MASKDVVPKDVNEPPEETIVEMFIPPPKKVSAPPAFKKIEPNSSSTISIYQISNGTIKPYKEVTLSNEKPSCQQKSMFANSEPEIIELEDSSPNKVSCNKVSSSNIPPESNLSRSIEVTSMPKEQEKYLFKNHICYICQESVTDMGKIELHFKKKHPEAGRNIELSKIMVHRVVCYLCGVRRREYNILVRHFNLGESDITLYIANIQFQYRLNFSLILIFVSKQFTKIKQLIL